MRIHRILTSLGAIALAGSLVTSAQAAEYPTKPITLIVPWKAGGTTETMGQILSKAMALELGQNVIVKTRPDPAAAARSARLMSRTRNPMATRLCMRI